MPDTAAAGSYVNTTGEFTRDQRYIATRSTADGRDGFPVEPGRYRLVVSRACPWANRSIIVRRLLGLEDALSMGVTGPTHVGEFEPRGVETGTHLGLELA